MKMRWINISKPIGFDQKVLLHQLDFTANETRRLQRKEMYNVLDNFVRADIQGAKSRKNAITMLMKIWHRVEQNHIIIRDKALKMFPYLKPQEKVVLHWCMTLLAYPFFKDIVKEMGLNFRLHDLVSSQSLGRKMKNLYGDRRRVEVATSAVLMSIRSWGIISPQKGREYTISEKITIDSPELLQLLAEVLLTIDESDALPLDLMNNNALFFPFEYNISIGDLKNKNFDMINSLDLTMIELQN
jgi:hypothetical protein